LTGEGPAQLIVAWLIPATAVTLVGVADEEYPAAL
jgi:hypothetical protein